MRRERSSENSVIARIVTKGTGESAGLVLGIGDDCAVFRPAEDEDLVFTTDLFLEDRHFRRTDHSAGSAGHKTLARGLSDLAAMGASPRFCLLSLALPDWADDAWIDEFLDGFLALARRAGIPLAGGDLARQERFAADIVACGGVPRGLALRRSGAQAGDWIYVSGQLGGAALGLESGTGAAWERHLRPEPRLDLGCQLRTWGATAAIDVSDGLALDLHRLCLASGVAAVLDGIPLFPGASLQQALHGGDDYELVFTLPAPLSICALGDLPLTCIGRIRNGEPGTMSLGGQALVPAGYDHFQTP
ncbi:MAG: thiamine-phosphate kinase [Bryobacterales bacterium]|nr:thiamine-phosphate kinase [Bryobacterales bacterium]